MSVDAGRTFKDALGVEQRQARIRWWDHGATTYRTASIVSADVADQLPERELEADDRRYAYHASKPPFFGHYLRALLAR